MNASPREAIGLVALLICGSFGLRGSEDPSQRAQTAAGASAAEQATVVEDLPPGVTLRDPDGVYPAGLPNDPAFFALGVWLESVTDRDVVELDRSFGLNLYVGLADDGLADVDAIDAGGMHLLLQADEWIGDARADHRAVDGWLVYDEADLMFGPGWDAWDGRGEWNSCIPIQDQGGRCGYTVMQHYSERLPPDVLRYANYGVGLLHFESDREADVFVNHGFQDVVSADDYAFTRPDAAPEDRNGAAYGSTVERVRRLDARDGVRQPVWGFVEVGHPFSEATSPTITAPQVRSAVWHSIIAGARGIVYFNHSFGGPCPTASVLRAGCDPDMAPAVTGLNTQITELAPVLNAPFADGYVTARGPVEVMAKRGPDGAWYVFAGADTTGADTTGPAAEVTFDIAAGSTVEVLFEDRNLTVTDGRFVDAFDGPDAVHVYRIT